ncbi:MAG: Hsp20 family protein [Bacteriovorax sp.]|jgi:HSP20 family molecular chaperone IbpA
MKVNEASAEAKAYSIKLDEKLRNDTAKKEAEIKNINQIYEKQIESAKSEGQDKYISSLNRNDEMLVSASKDFEKKLSNYKDNLRKTQSYLAKEDQGLREEHQEQMDSQREQFEGNIQEKFKNAMDIQQDINGQMKNRVELVTDKSLAERRKIETGAKNSTNNLALEYGRKAAAEERNYRSKLESDIRMHQENINIQEKELKKEADTKSDKDRRLVQEKMVIQQAELNYLDNHQKDILSQKQNDFKVRYDNLVNEHNALIEDLKSSFEADVKKMAQETTVQKRNIAAKEHDTFYRIETLKPTIVENEKEYMVSLPVPEYEKENVHLSVRGRGVKMTLTRRFTDTIEDKDGSTNRSTKNELFSREFPCKDILNPKLVDQKYENGILTYRIQKL